MSVELEKMCRTCLAVDTAMLSIFDSHKSGAKDEKSFSLAAMLNTFTAAAISEKDGLPKQVCLPCISEIHRVYLFKIKCDNSQNTLKKYMEKLSPANGGEIVDSEDDDVIIVQDVKVDCDEVLLFEAPIDVKEKENDLNVNGEEGIIRDNDILVRNEGTAERGDNEAYETTQQYNEQFAECTKSNQITPEIPQKESLKCPLCLTSFSEKRSFLRHVLGRHSNDLPVALVDAILCNMNDDPAADIQQNQDTELHDETYDQMMDTDYEPEPDEFTDITEYPRVEHYSYDEMTAENQGPTGVFPCYVCSQKFETHHECDIHLQLCHEENQKGQIAWSPMECRIEIDSGAMDKEDKSETETDKTNSQNEKSPDKQELENDNSKINNVDVGRTRSATLQSSPSSFIVKLDKNLRKKLECNVCKKIFISEKSLASHLKSHNQTATETPKRSGKNDHQTVQKENVEAKQHDEVKNQCPICKKVFQKMYSLRCHILTHNSNSPCECPVCGKSLSSRRNRNNHLLLHTTLGFQCNICRKSFTSEKELNLHRAKHPRTNIHVCNTCGCAFTNKKVLAKHDRIHKKDRPHACTFCPMRFKISSALKCHLRAHTGEKPYRCHYCNRGFVRTSDCTKHLATHTMKNAEICPLCGLSFHEPEDLKKHYELNHPNESHNSPEIGNEQLKP